MEKIIRLLSKKKVTLSDVASPKPSRAAARVLKGAMIRAHADQQRLSKEAHAIRTN